MNIKIEGIKEIEKSTGRKVKKLKLDVRTNPFGFDKVNWEIEFEK